MNKFYYLFLVLIVLNYKNIAWTQVIAEDLKIYSENPFYWEYKNEPVLLLGASDDDNLFQMDTLESHLDLLQSVGGNYIRCTMSSRDEGNVKPFEKISGKYDLNKPNPEYWNRFENLLKLSAERNIIVQVEIWATYDFYWNENRWDNNPFNPAVNNNYTSENSGLPDFIDYPAQSKINPFFNSVAALENNKLLLVFQQKFVDQLLSISLNYLNVLYCIDNETCASKEWGKHWSSYIRRKAVAANREILVTEMWDNWDPTDGRVEEALSQNPDLGDWFAKYTNMELHDQAKAVNTIEDTASYQFVDISNNNAQSGEIHFWTCDRVRSLVRGSGKKRPINNVKIYGGTLEGQIWAGTAKDGTERFWRNIFLGHAAARFHRPPAGLGLNEVTMANIKSMRMLLAEFNLFKSTEATNVLLGEREENEAYCRVNPEQGFIIYFPNGGEVFLRAYERKYEVKKLNIATSVWTQKEIVQLEGKIKTPTGEQWAVLIKKM
ncbi:MAG: hypothetical protein AAFZ15_31165 [Bacteroidota bacterium]